MSDPLLTSSADGVREMRLNRPEKRNAITYAMYEALYRGLTGAQADETVRVVLLTGEGAAVCVGTGRDDVRQSRPRSQPLTLLPVQAARPLAGRATTMTRCRYCGPRQQ